MHLKWIRSGERPSSKIGTCPLSDSPPLTTSAKRVSQRPSVSSGRYPDLGSGMWDLGCGIWDLGSGIWDPGCGVLDLGCGMWDLGCGMWDLGSEIWDVGCGI